MQKMADAEVRRSAFRKKRQGVALTPEEEAEFRAYFRERAKLRCIFYAVDRDEKEGMEAQAKEDGYTSFADWCRDMVHRGRAAATRTETEWNDALDRLAKAEARFEDQLSMTHELMEKASRYERERDEARAEAQELRNALITAGKGA